MSSTSRSKELLAQIGEVRAIGTLLDPEGLALAASGVAITAVPEASKELRVLVVDGAPDLVRMGSDQLVGMVPRYREVLQAEIDPVLDQVSSVLAEAAMERCPSNRGTPRRSTRMTRPCKPPPRPRWPPLTTP